MSETYTVEPPAVNAWWDPVDVPDAVRARLRVNGGDIDDDRILSLVPAAGRIVNNYVDSVDAVVTHAALSNALVEVAVSLYHAPPGDNTYDVLAGARRLIDPFRERFGVA